MTKESTVATDIITLADINVGDMVRPKPGTYTSRLTRTEKRKGEKPVVVTFKASDRFRKVIRTNTPKRPGTVDIHFAGGVDWYAYPLIAEVEIKRTRKAAPKVEETPKPTARKRTPAGGLPARRSQPVDGNLAAKVKKLRDGGMAWWRIGVELKLPGGGPLPAGKRGAGQARKLYKAINNGELPASARSNGGGNPAPTRRRAKSTEPKPAKRQSLKLEELSNDELIEKLQGRTITYNYAKASLGEAEPVKVAKVKKFGEGRNGRNVSFYSQASKGGYSNERTVYVSQIVKVA
jgi:hypothetical protein